MKLDCFLCSLARSAPGEGRSEDNLLPAAVRRASPFRLPRSSRARHKSAKYQLLAPREIFLQSSRFDRRACLNVSGHAMVDGTSLRLQLSRREPVYTTLPSSDEIWAKIRDGDACAQSCTPRMLVKACLVWKALTQWPGRRPPSHEGPWSPTGRPWERARARARTLRWRGSGGRAMSCSLCRSGRSRDPRSACKAEEDQTHTRSVSPKSWKLHIRARCKALPHEDRGTGAGRVSICKASP